MGADSLLVGILSEMLRSALAWEEEHGEPAITRAGIATPEQLTFAPSPVDCRSKLGPEHHVDNIPGGNDNGLPEA